MKIVFFGLGTVAGVMATCLNELCKRSGTKVEFVFIVRHRKKACEELKNTPGLLKKANFIEVDDFGKIFRSPDQFKKIHGASALINSSLPVFNMPILKLAEMLGANYTDFSSNMYNTRTLKTKDFEQRDLQKKMAAKKLFGLINIGISPGVTNFLIGEKIRELQRLAPEIRFKELNIYLLEDVSSRQIYFSWSPAMALDELEEHPRYYENGVLKKVEPFSVSSTCEFPFHSGAVDQYPVYQEEVLALRKSFPELKNIKIFTGGSEVELIKNLYQLNLLSKRRISCLKHDISIEKVIRLALPGMQRPSVIKKAVKDGLINRAQFAAVGEITLETRSPVSGLITTITEKIGMSFHRFRELIGTSYAGTTYIGYCTGVGAAVLFFYTFKAWEKARKKYSGILSAEQLPALFGPSRSGQVKRELSCYKLDFASAEQTLEHSGVNKTRGIRRK